jgi:ATP-dependent DNA helicase RecG
MFFRKNDEDMEFRHAGIVCVLFKGTGRATILDAKELNGDAVSNIDNAVIFLKKHLRISYVIKTLQREEILELPEDALREAIINAVCHRLWSEKGARIMVEIFDDRVDIVSPGGVCKGITPENFGTISITRNPLITGLLHRINYIEQMGTGIKRMREATEKANVAEPVFELENFFKTTFKRTQIENSSGVLSPANRPPSAVNRLQSAVTADRKAVIISYLEKNSQAKTSDLINVIGLSEGRVRDLLREMVADVTIEKIGKNRHTYYVLKK